MRHLAFHYCLLVFDSKVPRRLLTMAVLPIQSLSDDSIREWYAWAGGTARACLKMNWLDPNGLENWKRDVKALLASSSTAELVVCCC